MHKKISILSIEHPLERLALNALFVLLALLVAGYLYFVGASILNIIVRKEAAADIDRLQSSIALTEKEYFELNKSVSPIVAGDMGLTQLSRTNYVYRPGNSASAVTIERDAI